MTTDPRDVPDLVRWYEGMLLLPEHFQAAARRQETLAPLLVSAAQPYAWGAAALNVVVDKKVVEVVAFEAIMPDGTLVVFPAADGSDEALTWTLDERQGPQVIHVAMQARGRLSAKGAFQWDGQGRYRSATGLDLAARARGAGDGSDPEDGWQRPRLQLWSNGEDTPPDRYVSMPVARVGWDGAKFLLQKENFQPPRFAIRAGDDEPVYRLVRKVEQGLGEEAKFIDSRLRADRARPDAGGPEGARRRERRGALARPWPRLRALLDSDQAHPFQLYLAVCDVVGELANLDDDFSSPAMAVTKYEHENMLPAFEALTRPIFVALTKLANAYELMDFTRVRAHDPARGQQTSGPASLPDQALYQLEVTEALKQALAGEDLIVAAFHGPAQQGAQVKLWMDRAVIALSRKEDQQKVLRSAGARRSLIDLSRLKNLPDLPQVLFYQVAAAVLETEALPAMLIVEGGPASAAPSRIVLFVKSGSGRESS